MKTKVPKGKTEENQSQKTVNDHSQNQVEATSQFVDKRPEIVAQQKMQALMNNGPKVNQLQAYQKMADGSSQTTETSQTAAISKGNVQQFYREEKGKGKQGGTFIRGGKQIHLHIDIGEKSHLKIEGSTIKIAKKGGLLDSSKIQSALESLIFFSESIKNDKPRAAQYAPDIKDCMDWLIENGATMPTVEKETEGKEKEVVKEDVEEETTDSYAGFFNEMGNSNKNNVEDEDDFM